MSATRRALGDEMLYVEHVIRTRENGNTCLRAGFVDPARRRARAGGR